jgi:YidC/Oxa1 family membrane protein insertase
VPWPAVVVLGNLLQPLITGEEWILEALHRLGLGWGLAIVALTVLVRLGMVPLVVRQLHAQRELQRHLPELKRLQRRYRDDRERLQRETAAYYRRHGINPLAPLVPLLLQTPVFISLYYLMRTDVASGLFGDAGFLFIPKLTQPPHGTVALILVLAYAASQLVSGLLGSRTLGTGHRSLVVALPLLFAGVVARLPAGLAVYWVTSSLWGLGQRLLLLRVAPTASSPPPKGSVPAAPPRPRKRRRSRRARR